MKYQYVIAIVEKAISGTRKHCRKTVIALHTKHAAVVFPVGFHVELCISPGDGYTCPVEWCLFDILQHSMLVRLEPITLESKEFDEVDWKMLKKQGWKVRVEQV